MVARQVLRAALAALVALALALPARARAADEAVSVGVIDVRPPGAPDAPYDAVVVALSTAAGVRLVADPAAAAALAGRDAAERAEVAGRAAEVEARAAYADLRCADVGPLVETAVLALARAGELIDARGERAARLLAMALLCAHQGGDRSGATAAAQRMRHLGVGRGSEPPPGVSAEIWAQYPDIDATSNELPVKLVVETDVPGARVWVDLESAGPAPAHVALAPGRHWIVARDGARVATQVVTLEERKSTKVVLTLTPADDAANPWKALRDRVASWRRGAAWEAKSLARAMRDASVVVSVVLVPSADGGVDAQIWWLDTDRRAVRATAVPGANPDAVVRAVGLAAETRRTASSPALPGAPTGASAGGEKTKSPGESRTWSLVTAGALVLGAIVVVVAAEAGDTVQRIEVGFP